MKKFRVALLVLLAGVVFSFSSCFEDEKATIYVANISGDIIWHLKISGTEYFARLNDDEYIKIEVPTGENQIIDWYSGVDYDAGTAIHYVFDDPPMDIDPGTWTAEMKPGGLVTVTEGDIYNFESYGSSEEYGRSAVPGGV